MQLFHKYAGSYFASQVVHMNSKYVFRSHNTTAEEFKLYERNITTHK